MIKINLLPPHIHQRKQVKIATGVVVVMLAGEIAGMLVMRNPALAQKAKHEARQQEVQGLLDGVKKVESDSNTVLGEEAALAPKYDFITGMLKYNTAYPDLYTRTAGYTFREATLLNLEATTNQLKFDAYVSDSADVARLMIGLSNSPDFTQLPQITGVPDYNSAERKQREAELNESNVPESLIIGGAVAGAGGAGGGYPGMGGEMGGYPGMGASGMSAPGMGGYPGGGALSAAGGPGMSSMGGGGEMGGYPGMGGSMGGGGGNGDISKLRLETAKLKPRGFTVTVTCGLKTPISQRPSYADSEAQAGSSGGGGGMMGGMSGYPGMGGPPMR